MYTLEKVDPLSAAVYNQLLAQPQQILVSLYDEGRVVTTHHFGAREAQINRITTLIRDTAICLCQVLVCAVYDGSKRYNPPADFDPV